jgi:hypothetical protein
MKEIFLIAASISLLYIGYCYCKMIYMSFTHKNGYFKPTPVFKVKALTDLNFKLETPEIFTDSNKLIFLRDENKMLKDKQIESDLLIQKLSSEKNELLSDLTTIKNTLQDAVSSKKITSKLYNTCFPKI